MTEPFYSVFANPDINDSEPLVSLELLASHKASLTTERSALEPEDIPSEDCDLLVIMPRQHDNWFLTPLKRLNELLDFVAVSV